LKQGEEEKYLLDYLEEELQVVYYLNLQLCFYYHLRHHLLNLQVLLQEQDFLLFHLHLLLK
tara:strand:- start:134 stop:316 length:183 start_codon:yes stop_codon:yes gene_type:complete